MNAAVLPSTVESTTSRNDSWPLLLADIRGGQITKEDAAERIEILAYAKEPRIRDPGM